MSDDNRLVGDLSVKTHVNEPQHIPAPADDDIVSSSKSEGVYNDTIYFIDNIVNSYNVFPAILDMMREGKATVELRKRYLLRAMDEAWVNIIEDTLPALDYIIRNPSKTIEEIEEVLPIELSRNIAPRSLVHLSQHTNMISKIEGDNVTPNKILNVYREETMQTYENKFVNTLINRLYIFVHRRYEIALKSGVDQKTTSLNFSEDFSHGVVKGKMSFSVEISEPAEDATIERNYTSTTDLWKRVVKLNEVCSAYQNSAFVKEMGKSYIRPPVMHTNAILKNKNLKQCLDLWQFIESYEEAGFNMIVEESLENISEDYLKELYSTLAVQYMIFRHNINNDFVPEDTLDKIEADKVYSPRIVDELTPADDREFDLHLEDEERHLPMPGTVHPVLTPEDELYAEAITTAIEAYRIYSEEEDYLQLQSPEIAEPVDEYVPGTEDLPEEENVADEEIGETEPEAESASAGGSLKARGPWKLSF